jgi:hypothetical protein
MTFTVLGIVLLIAIVIVAIVVATGRGGTLTAVLQAEFFLLGSVWLFLQLVK